MSETEYLNALQLVAGTPEWEYCVVFGLGHDSPHYAGVLPANARLLFVEDNPQFLPKDMDVLGNASVVLTHYTGTVRDPADNWCVALGSVWFLLQCLPVSRVLVDGPWAMKPERPGRLGPIGYAIDHVLKHTLNAEVLLHDAHRAHESALLTRFASQDTVLANVTERMIRLTAVKV